MSPDLPGPGIPTRKTMTLFLLSRDCARFTSIAFQVLEKVWSNRIAIFSQLRRQVSTTICRPKYLLLGDPSEIPLATCPNRSKAFAFPFFMARVARDNISLVAPLHQIYQHMSPLMTLSHTSFDVWLLRLGWLLYITIYIFTQVVNPFNHGYLGYQPQ
jgi:hypothetical protein